MANAARVTYPAALQRYKLDAPLLAAGVLTLEFLLGAVTACINVPLISSLQTRVPIDYQGRFFALLSFSANLLIPLGITYTGFLASLVGADLAYIINNLCVILIVLLCRAYI